MRYIIIKLILIGITSAWPGKWVLLLNWSSAVRCGGGYTYTH